MANPRVLTKRRKAVRNIRKITHTMQLIATSRYQKALTKATASKPYAERITELVQELSGAGEQVRHPLLETHPDAKRSILLVVTSNRGLCGGYNSGLLRMARKRARQVEQSGQAVELNVIGKKGVGYYNFLKQPLAKAVSDFPDTPTFVDVEPLADEYMRVYQTGAYRSVQVVYMRFVSAARQVPTCTQLLPIRSPAADSSPGGPKSAARGGETQYDFSPPPAELLAALLPETVKVGLFQCFIDAVVSEQVARMVAMKAATDAADDMIKMLSRQYNRARQSQITSELLDIIGGAEALK
ncbi:MAG: ATP synthase F1 subunit gamma [Planctomycetes bacterium]|nr:ATP synthase F1 subunit gamma [Planctomycetota bacterium]